MPRIGELAISSPDIRALARIPDHHTGRGADRPPRLEITGVPEGTVELTVIVHDPDAPSPHGFTHWVVHGLTPAERVEVTPDAGRPGPNSTGRPGWVGPFPPAGHGVHHYYFWAYALSRPVEGAPSREEFLDRYADAIIEQARFVATYSS